MYILFSTILQKSQKISNKRQATSDSRPSPLTLTQRYETQKEVNASEDCATTQR